MTIKTIGAMILLAVSAVMYAVFWIWAILHATRTPRATTLQKVLWGVALVANPSTAVWYWYVWKRWAFWALFTPIFGAFVSLPLLVHSALSKTQTTTSANILYGLGNAPILMFLAVLMIGPLVFRLAALLHLGKNTELSAMDRNDWIVSLAMPIFGFGAAVAYCARYRRVWAIAGFVWTILFALAFQGVIYNISHALIGAGVERRAELR